MSIAQAGPGQYKRIAFKSVTGLRGLIQIPAKS